MSDSLKGFLYTFKKGNQRHDNGIRQPQEGGQARLFIQVL